MSNDIILPPPFSGHSWYYSRKNKISQIFIHKHLFNVKRFDGKDDKKNLNEQKTIYHVICHQNRMLLIAHFILIYLSLNTSRIQMFIIQQFYVCNIRIFISKRVFDQLLECGKKPIKRTRGEELKMYKCSRWIEFKH